MRSLNVFLAIFVSLLLGAAVLEIGLRFLGMGPQETINRFDPDTGWSKEPGVVGHRKTSEFDVTYHINELGLRGPPMRSPAKAPGVFRVLFLGDSFTLGYTVDESDHFVEQLASAWRAEERNVDVINAGTEAWSTDNEVAWYLKHGAEFQPDLVLLFTYENDLFWNGQAEYERFPKPRFRPDGILEPRELKNPGPKPWADRFALSLAFRNQFLARFVGPKIPGGIFAPEARLQKDPENPRGLLMREWAALMVEPPDFMQDAIARTRGALQALKTSCEQQGASLIVVPLPSKAAVQQSTQIWLRSVICLKDSAWAPRQPVQTFLDVCSSLQIKTLDPNNEQDPLSMCRIAGLPDEDGEPTKLFFDKDFHFNAQGNRVLSNFLHKELQFAFPPEHAAKSSALAGAEIPTHARPKSGVPKAVPLFALLWAALSGLYLATYKDEPRWQPPLKVLALLAAVFGIVIGGKWAIALLPPQIAGKFALLFIAVVLGFVIYKLGRRLTTILELFGAFVLRGHWYLMPLIVVLLSIGSLLVVAASSPLVAPFIYTLF
jgi:uncharacterized protein DUF5989